jgi:hypothetical protein
MGIFLRVIHPHVTLELVMFCLFIATLRNLPANELVNSLCGEYHNLARKYLVLYILFFPVMSILESDTPMSVLIIISFHIDGSGEKDDVICCQQST